MTKFGLESNHSSLVLVEEVQTSPIQLPLSLLRDVEAKNFNSDNLRQETSLQQPEQEDYFSMKRVRTIYR